jgi:hypothetical protein
MPQTLSRIVILSEAKDLLFAADCISLGLLGAPDAARDKGHFSIGLRG